MNRQSLCKRSAGFCVIAEMLCRAARVPHRNDRGSIGYVDAEVRQSRQSTMQPTLGGAPARRQMDDSAERLVGSREQRLQELRAGFGEHKEGGRGGRRVVGDGG